MLHASFKGPVKGPFSINKVFTSYQGICVGSTHSPGERVRGGRKRTRTEAKVIQKMQNEVYIK